MTGCPLCQDAADSLWQDDFCRVIEVEDDDYPGFCRVILTAHVKEMTDLSEGERLRLMNVVWATEAAVREVLQPDKVNLASLGNWVPHLHWHVIPRFAGDRHFPEAIWAPARHDRPFRPAPSDLRMRLAAALARRLDPTPE